MSRLLERYAGRGNGHGGGVCVGSIPDKGYSTNLNLKVRLLLVYQAHLFDLPTEMKCSFILFFHLFHYSYSLKT